MLSCFLPIGQVFSLPSAFPSSGNVLWYRTPAASWTKEYLPVGNGYLAAMLSGGTQLDQTQLNIESLWSGGPFQNASYNGGNHPTTQANYLTGQMQDIRRAIFASENGTTEKCSETYVYLGSYTAAPWLFTSLNMSGDMMGYFRWLDLDSAIARSTWTANNVTFTRETFCSNPSKACTQLTNSSIPAALSLSYYFTSVLGSPIPRVTCFDDATLKVRGAAGEPGMQYEILARVRTTPASLATCSSSANGNSTITVVGAESAWITWVGGTEFNLDAGNVAHGYSYKGVDPHDALVSLLQHATTISYTSHMEDHLNDYWPGIGKFSLSLGQTPEMSQSTDELVASYQMGIGNPYLEWLIFNYGRYLLFSSARGLLPANLQGKWGRDTDQSWGADANINLQMNYWAAEPTNLDVQESLWNYMEKNWATRGAETAKVLYNVSRGWVTHNEKIFGYTGMKGVNGTASWANYPESAVWMMGHIWDHFDYTNDISWWKSQGWPLLKGVASFHLDKLIEDLHFNDNTLVTAPCNSPEQTPITFGCAHQQQLIWQMLNAVDKGFAASGDTDTEFLKEVQAKRNQMDMGLRIGSWGQLQEWKVDMDQQNDTHREIAHLVGLYPGYALSSYVGQNANYSKDDLWQAAQVSLVHRGNGTGPDADAGWEKVWRAAAWAQFAKTNEFYDELTYSIQRNFGSNLFSLYDPGDTDPIFQIDANLGYPGALLNALVQAPDVPYLNSTLLITLLPALPKAWSFGNLRGLRVRGGITLDLQWANGAVTGGSIVVDNTVRERQVGLIYRGKQIDSFTTRGGMTRSFSL
ncbi:glycoside hydrolase family 95 protein [Ramaria rubella]|nr:glycoside hydrolase family 95 protein [Ramaria rubella]